MPKAAVRYADLVAATSGGSVAERADRVASLERGMHDMWVADTARCVSGRVAGPCAPRFAELVSLNGNPLSSGSSGSVYRGRFSPAAVREGGEARVVVKMPNMRPGCSQEEVLAYLRSEAYQRGLVESYVRMYANAVSAAPGDPRLERLRRRIVAQDYARLMREGGGLPDDVDAPDAEFYAGVAVNRVLRSVPNFVTTYAFAVAQAELRRDDDDRQVVVRLGRGRPVPVLMVEYVPGATFHQYAWRLNQEAAVSQTDRVLLTLSHMLQVLLALQVAQDEARFTHYDLSTSNVLMHDLGRVVWFVYHVGGRAYWLPTTHRAVVIDLGRAHAEGAPRARAQYGLTETPGPGADLVSLGVVQAEFSPVWDMVTFVKNVCVYSGGAADPQSAASHRVFRRLLRFMVEEFGEDPDPDKVRHYGTLATGSRSVHAGDGRPAIRCPLDLVDTLAATRFWRRVVLSGRCMGGVPRPVFHWGPEAPGGRVGRARGMQRATPPADLPPPRIRINELNPVSEDEDAYVRQLVRQQQYNVPLPAPVARLYRLAEGRLRPPTGVHCRLHGCPGEDEYFGLCAGHYLEALNAE